MSTPILEAKDLTRVFRVDPGQSWPEMQMGDDGLVSRYQASQQSFDCKPSGLDRIVFLPLTKGYEVTGVVFSHGRTDSGDGVDGGAAGSRTFFPGYALGDWRDEGVGSARVSVLHVNWGVWRAHRSPMAGITEAADKCESDYRLAVSVIGPVGVPPYGVQN